LKNGWLKDFTWLKRKKRVRCTYEEIRVEAEKYEYLYDFINNSRKEYDAAYTHGWLKDFTWLKRYKPRNKVKPSKEECFEIAKRYDMVKTFASKCGTIYLYAKSMGWLDDYIWFKGIYRRWSSTRCEEEARKYKTLKSFEKNCYGGYHVSVKEGWISKFDWLT